MSTVCCLARFQPGLYISEFRSILDLASPMWTLGYQGELNLWESVQCRWTKQVDDLNNLSYADTGQVWHFFR